MKKVYDVWHKKESRFGVDWGLNGNKAPDKINLLRDYDYMASVDAPNLGEVFRATNHIDHPWWENPEVVFHVKESRSTSVEDVVVFDGRIFLCLPIGWKEVEEG